MIYRHFLSLLRRFVFGVVAATLAGLLIGLLATLLIPAKYEATSRVFIGVRSSVSLSDLSNGGTYLQDLVRSYTVVATTPLVLSPVVSELKLPYGEEELARRVKAEAPIDTVVMSITVTDDEPTRSAQIANAVARRLGTSVNGLTPPTEGFSTAAKVTQLQSASTPLSPVFPRPAEWAAGGALIGLALVLLLLLAIARASRVVRSEHDLDSSMRMDVIGRLSLDGSPSAVANKFESLRLVLEAYITPTRRVLLITAPDSTRQQGTIVERLAAEYAKRSFSVLVVDAGAPAASHIDQSDGIRVPMEYWAGASPLKTSVALPSSGVIDRVELSRFEVDGQRRSKSDFLNDASQLYEYVLVAAAPISRASTLSLVAGGASTLVVVSAHQTVLEEVERAVRLVEAVGKRSPAVLLVQSDRQRRNSEHL